MCWRSQNEVHYYLAVEETDGIGFQFSNDLKKLDVKN